MTSVVRAGHLAPFFKASSPVVANGLKIAAAVPITTDKMVVKPLPNTTTVHTLHGALPIQGLRPKCSTHGEVSILYHSGYLK
jgi:hypothetical protein